jgi:hypothetical protein
MNDHIKRLSLYFKTGSFFTCFQLVTQNEQLESNIRVSRPEDSGTSGPKTDTELRTETDTETEKQLRIEISNLRANLHIAEEERESLSQENEKLKSLIVDQKL